MKTALLDLNILTALLWPAHEHHDVAHGWFAARGKARWATCPMTQLGFVRIVSNAAFSSDVLSPIEATALLAENLTHTGHEFWSEDLEVPSVVGKMDAGLQGYRQLTDAYLLALAHRHKGILATFDRRVRTLASSSFNSSLEVVATR